MKALSLVAAPLVWLLSKSTALVTKAIGLKESENKVTEEEIKAIVREGMDTGEVRPSSTTSWSASSASATGTLTPS